MNAVAPIEPAQQEQSTLEALQALLKREEFDPLAFIVQEIKRPPGALTLGIEGKVRAAETIAKLRLDYEKLEAAAKAPNARGMRMTLGADGTVQADMWEAGFDGVTDEQLEAEIRRDVAALGLIADSGADD